MDSIKVGENVGYETPAGSQSQKTVFDDQPATVEAVIAAAATIDHHKLILSGFKNAKDNKPVRHELPWFMVKQKFGKHITRNKKDGAAFSPVGYLSGATRGNEGVEFVTCAVLDVDDGTPIENVQSRISGYAHLIYTTHSHTPAHQKYRVVIPFAKAVPVANWDIVWRQVNALTGGVNDPNTKDPARLYYMPSHPSGAEGCSIIQKDGELLDPDSLPKPTLVAADTVVIPSKKHAPKREIKIIEGQEEAVQGLNSESGLVEMVARCLFMKTASQPENQNSVSEALWLAEILNAVCFEGGRQWIHEASCHHDGYSEEETEAKIRHVIQKKYGPATCEYISKQGFTGCPTGGCRLPSGYITKSPAGLMSWSKQSSPSADGDEYQVGEFTVNKHGVFYNKPSKDGSVQKIRISSRIDVIARTRSVNGDRWGSLLMLTDPDGTTKKWAFSSSMLSGNGDDLRKVILGMGGMIEAGVLERNKFTSYLSSCMPSGRALAVTQPGWHQAGDQKVYVTKDRAIGKTDLQIVLQSANPKAFEIFDKGGSVEDWNTHVGSRCIGNSRLVMAVSAALSAPVLNLMGLENMGFHFVGGTSIGKTIALKLAATVYGGVKNIQTWRATSNGLEAIASRHNDGLLCLDEMGEVNGKEVGETAYMLGNGQGKVRATIEAEAKEVKKFTLVYLSNGEVALKEHMQAAGKRVMAGQEVRLINIPADAGQGYGIFDNITGFNTSAEFAVQLSRDAMQYHGYAGMAFIEILADPERQPDILQSIREKQAQFMQAYTPASVDGQVGRVGLKFAFVAAVGEVCIELGVLPWSAGDVIAGVRRCYMDWIEHRGGVGSLEEEQVVEQVSRFIEQFGESRFVSMGVSGVAEDNFNRTPNRAGFRRTAEDGRMEYFVLPEMFKSDICAGLNPTFVSKVLAGRGLLAIGKDGKPQVTQRLPHLGPKRVYHILPSIMGEVCETEDAVLVEPVVSGLAGKYKV
jgi:putative DNA primase/helicase